MVLLAVGTPPGADGSADLTLHLQGGRDGGPGADRLGGAGHQVDRAGRAPATRSRRWCRKHATHEFAVASNPEFLKEGDAVNDFMKPDRIIIGTADKRAIETLQALYAPFTRSSDRVLVMDRRSAELTKYAANSMLATRISFMNDLANLCDALGADIELVRKGMGSDARIGTKFLYAGVGLRRQLLPQGPARGGQHRRARRASRLEMLEAVVAVNERQKRRLGEDDPRATSAATLGGQADRRLGPGVQARHRRHPRGAGAGPDRSAAGRRAPRWWPPIPQAIAAARKLLGDRVRFETSALQVRRGRRRPGAGHRVARVPAPQLRAAEAG